MILLDYQNRVKRTETASPLVIIATYNALFLNDVVMTELLELVDKVRKSIYFRQEIKQTINKINKARHKYETMVSEITTKQIQCFADLNDAFSDYIGNDLEILRLSFKRVISNDVHAQAAFTAMLCDAACKQLDINMRAITEEGDIIGSTLQYLRLTEVNKQVGELVEKFKIPDCDLTEVERALTIFLKKAGDGEEIMKILERE